MSLVSINPTTGEEIASYDEMSTGEAAEVVGATHEAFLTWRETPAAERSRLLAAAAAVLEEERENHAELMVREMGKPIVQARAEVDKCAWVCRYYAENGERFLAPEPVETDATKSYVAFEPLGVVLAVMPWNFPYWQVFRFAAPALAAGNTGLLKHASNVQGCALAIEEVFRRAGFPTDVFRTLVVGSSRVAAIIEDPRVKAVTLTGSTPAGQAVAGRAGSLLKKTVLELPGVCSTPVRAVSPPSGSLSPRVCRRSSRIVAGARWPQRSWVTPWTRRPTSDPLPVASSAKSSTAKCERASTPAPACCLAASCPTAPAPSIHQRFSPMSKRACRPTPRSSLDRWQRFCR
jgi:succinate-semialdehyde dehydrogenase/glutarate-semialdehyde dehydrogenase